MSVTEAYYMIHPSWSLSEYAQDTLIYNYLTGKLSLSEQLMFERKMAEDPAFALEVEELRNYIHEDYEGDFESIKKSANLYTVYFPEEEWVELRENLVDIRKEPATVIQLADARLRQIEERDLSKVLIWVMVGIVAGFFILAFFV